MISVRTALDLVKLSPDEKILLAKIEASVDETIATEYSEGKMGGAPIRFALQQSVEPKIAYALKRTYEARGGWQVNVASVAPLALQFIPVSMPAPARASTEPPALPSIVHVEAPKERAPKRLLVRMPTRSRPVQALNVLTKYRAMAGIPIQIEVILDSDDETMLAAPVLQRLSALGCVITVGEHQCKVEACNDGRVDTWDVLLLASDDMVPIVDGYAVRVLDEMEKHWPHLDGAIYFDDGFQGRNLCTLPIMGRRWYQQWGYVYHPSYKSLFCDTEQTSIWSAMRRLTYVDMKIIEHRHPAAGLTDKDGLYLRNDALWTRDEAVFKERSQLFADSSRFCFGTRPVLFSVCIATLPSRRQQLDLLVDEMYRQRAKLDYLLMADLGNVELVIDAGERSVGAKRQRLLERAVGRFVAFIDDDDMVSHDYLRRITQAISDNPTVDCLSMTGVMTTAGSAPERFVHKLGMEWGTVDGVHHRPPNHLNPVRRELALQAGFPSLNHAEDHKYALALGPLLKTSADIGDDPAYYYFFHPTKTDNPSYRPTPEAESSA